MEENPFNHVRDDDVFLQLDQADGSKAYLTVRRDGEGIKAFVFGEGLVPDQLSEKDMFIMLSNALYDLGTHHGYTIKNRKAGN